MKLIINPELEKMIAQLGLNRASALILCFAVEYLDDGAISEIIEMGLVEDEDALRINLLNVEYETGRWQNRIPVLVAAPSDDYNTFLYRLTDDLRFTINGHPENQVGWAVLSDTEETRMAYAQLEASIPDFLMEKLIAVVDRYYRTTQKPKSLVRFLAEDAALAYRTHTGPQSYRGLI